MSLTTRTFQIYCASDSAISKQPVCLFDPRQPCNVNVPKIHQPETDQWRYAEPMIAPILRLARLVRRMPRDGRMGRHGTASMLFFKRCSFPSMPSKFWPQAVCVRATKHLHHGKLSPDLRGEVLVAEKR